jgi:hypothetical protein
MAHHKHKMHTHSPSGHVGKHETTLHQKGMHTKNPSAVEPHPHGPSVDVADRPGTHYVPHVQAPGPRSA